MPNRLAGEKSPYLQQHAHNPVDWYPWGPEAFEKAKREVKPIFLSIGYSTCHWCHVMERESFENAGIATVLNRHFIPIKVDREERPDVDRIYMTFVQATTGGGGWPMSVFLTPDLNPFYGGTYFPPDNRYGRPGFKTLLERLAHAWMSDRPRIEQSGRDVIEQLRLAAGNGTDERHALDASLLDSGFYAFRRGFDSRFGGFGGAPKFPRPSVLNFLLRYHARTGNAEALEMTITTLRAMAAGGMHDQLGGGFHRYSVDERWFVPHFEKMLYDQAQLAISYLETFQITHDAFFAGVARDVLDYVLRDMTHPEGGFYSAEDADSVIDPAHPEEKGEGAFYIWTRNEVLAVLGQPAAGIIAMRYGIEEKGNVANDPHGEFVGRNILYVRHEVEEIATAFRMSSADVEEVIANAREKLLKVRALRVRPHLDDKILTAWNGLMISAFAKGAQILDEPRYAQAAARAADFILARLYQSGDGLLLRRFRDGDAAIAGFLDDYAFFIPALLDLYETDFETRRIDTAISLADAMRARFEDTANGGFYSTALGDSSLAIRMKDDYDGAEPTGNAIAILALLRLAAITNREEFRLSADRALQVFAAKIADQPAAVPQMLVGLDYSLSEPREIILVGGKAADSTRALLKKRRERFLPASITLLIHSDEARARLAQFTPAIEAMHEIGGESAAYVCRAYACRLPTADVAEFERLLQ